jgi:hypothetical protein
MLMTRHSPDHMRHRRDPQTHRYSKWNLVILYAHQFFL